LTEHNSSRAAAALAKMSNLRRQPMRSLIV
jgi:hypothetical protein